MENLYQSILKKLSAVPADYLPQIELYLQNLIAEMQKKEVQKNEILNLAGAWDEMSDENFADFLKHTRLVNENLFNTKPTE